MIHSHSFKWADFRTTWYERWAQELKQDETCLDGHMLHANKFWQNAVMAQVLAERGMLKRGRRGIGFGVGQERLPALFASHGVHTTASDQDFTAADAKHWAARELTRNIKSLNKLGICAPGKFSRYITYAAIDMRQIPADQYGKYDFLWSNCALGHLGSIPAGLTFIEESIRCLRPGGWATHTTELNILSNSATVSDGDTVIFRLRDVHDLQKRLIRQGYQVCMFSLTLGHMREDNRISLAPQFGNDYAKLHIHGHLATQIVLIIHKPKVTRAARFLVQVNRPYLSVKASCYYVRNRILLAQYVRHDKTLHRMLATRSSAFADLRISALKPALHIEIPKGKRKVIRIRYKNNATLPVLGVYTDLTAMPVVLATATPYDRRSVFYDQGWLSRNRPAHVIWARQAIGGEQPVELAEAEFLFKVVLNTQNAQPGEYLEDFCLVQEGVGWVPNTTIRVHIRVV